jgi:hypothetical protein
MLLVNGEVREILRLFVLIGRRVSSDGWFYISMYFCTYQAVPARRCMAQNRNELTVLILSHSFKILRKLVLRDQRGLNGNCMQH